MHPVLGGLLAKYLLPKEALDWIAPFKQTFSSLMYFISNRALRRDTLRNYSESRPSQCHNSVKAIDPAKLAEKPQISFAKQLHIALRHVVNNFKLNTSQGGSDGWLTNEGLWLMSRNPTADRVFEPI